MSDANDILSNGYVQILWGTGLTAWIAWMGRASKKRDDAIDATAKAVSTLELKVAENYATKTTVNQLFNEAVQQTKDAVGRVEKSIDATNAAVTNMSNKMDSKMDNLNSSLSALSTGLLQKVMDKIA